MILLKAESLNLKNYINNKILSVLALKLLDGTLPENTKLGLF